MVLLHYYRLGRVSLFTVTNNAKVDTLRGQDTERQEFLRGTNGTEKAKMVKQRLNRRVK